MLLDRIPRYTGSMARMLPVLVIIVIGLSLLFFGYGFFNAKNFELITERDCVSEDRLRGHLANMRPNLLVTSQKTINSSLKSQFGCIESVSLQKTYPSTLKVKVHSNLPIARFENSNFLLSSNGEVVEGSTSAKVPSVFPQSKLEKTVLASDPDVAFASAVIKGLKDSDFSVQSVRILGSENIVVYNSENAIAVFSAKMDIDLQIRSLQSVMAKSKIDAAKISKIDLRYTMPVVVFK